MRGFGLDRSTDRSWGSRGRPRLLTIAIALLGLASTAIVAPPQSRIEDAVKISRWDATGPARLLPRQGPRDAPQLDVLSFRATPGEVEPASFVISAKRNVAGLLIEWTELTHRETGETIPAAAIDVFWVKCWYQAGGSTVYKERGRPYLVPELLLLDDELMQVDLDAQRNFLRIADEGEEQRVSVTSPGDSVPAEASVRQSPVLRPLNLPAGEHKQVWLSVRVPASATPGLYEGEILLNAPGLSTQRLPLELEVLPFTLPPPRLEMAMYYRGQLRDGDIPRRHQAWKTSERMRMDLADMLDHGITHPTLQYWGSKLKTRDHISRELALRDELGFPKDPTYFIGVYPGSPRTAAGLVTLQRTLTDWLEFFARHERRDVYFYGKDEAKGEELAGQRIAWETVHALGARMFVAGNEELSTRMPDVLDLGVVAGDFDPEIPRRFHAHGNRAFSYANPQAGLEDPDRYRRSYGLELWKAGYDGAMTYAYNDFVGDMWNDFDGEGNPRDLMFTYPIDGSAIGTVQWEGLREGVDDLRYLAALQDRVEAMQPGRVRGGHIRWIERIDARRSPAALRAEIIERILAIDGQSAAGAPANGE